MKSKILILYQQKQTVFTAKEIALLWQEKNQNNLKSAIKYYIDKGELLRIRQGVYAKSQFSLKEAAVKIYSPSYISFETVLSQAGIIYQYYENIFVASYLKRQIKLISGQKIIYRKLRDNILYLPDDITTKDSYQIATPERAFLDSIYLFGEPYFDNLSKINWKTCFIIAPLYKNKALLKRLNKYYKNYAQGAKTQNNND